MNKKSLVIAIRGWTNTGDWMLCGHPGGEIPQATLAALQVDMPDAEIWAPELSLPLFCMETPESVSERLFHQVDAYVSARPELTSITLLGYSAGSLLARRIFCMAHGAGASGDIEHPAKPWAHKVHRNVMLAGITRGWEFSTASPDHVRFLSPVLFGIARLVGFVKGLGQPSSRKYPFIWRLLRGSSFVVSTRILYVRVIESLRNQPQGGSDDQGLTASGVPSTVFLLGARDEYISPADCTELGPRAEFLYVELPGATHYQALVIEGKGAEIETRRQRLVAALKDSFIALNDKDWVIPPEDIDDYLDPMDLVGEDALRGQETRPVEHVVMVVHGIRDDGFWTKRVAREIKSLARELGISVRAPTPSYGYFSMWDFVKPGGRERAARWFMERYADVQSHFPGARISFVGHSNGTYIAARALSLCPAIKLHRVVLAGSVLRCSYDWSKVSGQVGQVLNYVGSADSVVAFLPAVFERLGLRFMDVGGAGAYGFDFAKEPLRTQLSFPLAEVQYVQGGHGAAIGEGSWPEIAQFVLKGTLPCSPAAERVGWLRGLYRAAPVLTVIGGSVAVGLLAAPLIAAAWTLLRLEVPITSTVLTVGAVFVGLGVSWISGRFLKAW
ncbi:MAG: hypothetical protein QM639_10745 [Rhodocyclaceae bacterium]